MSTQNRWDLAKSRVKRLDVLFCAILLSLALAIGWAATRSGPGVNPDSAFYIDMARNISRGHGFIADLSWAFDPLPYNYVAAWPPGYSLLVAGLMAFGIDSVEAAKWVPILSFGLLTVVVYWLGFLLGDRTIALLSAVSTLLLMPVLRVATFARSEMSFMLFSTLALISMVEYVASDQKSEVKWLGLGGLLTAMALFTRYIGLIWLLVGVILIGFKLMLRSKGGLGIDLWKKGGKHAGAFVLISLAPTIPWLIRNKILTGYLTGLNRLTGAHPTVMENIRYLLETLTLDLIPSIHFGIRSIINRLPWMVWLTFIVAGGVVLWLFLRSVHRKGLFSNQNHLDNRLIPVTHFSLVGLIPLLYILVYIVGLIIMGSVQLYPAYDWPRYLVVIYPMILVLWSGAWVAFIKFLTNISLKGYGVNRNWIQGAVILFSSLLWIIPYAIQATGFVYTAANGQEYTTAMWRNSQGIAYLDRVLSENDVVWSDLPVVINYYLRIPVRYLPVPTELDRFAKLLDAQPTNRAYGEFFIVFKGAYRKNDPNFPSGLSNAEMAILAKRQPNLRLMADYEDASIYQLVRSMP